MASDYNERTRNKGFLPQAPTDFSYIVPDRKPISMGNVDKYITIADLIAKQEFLTISKQGSLLIWV